MEPGTAETIGKVIDLNQPLIRPYMPGAAIPKVVRPSFPGTFAVGGNPYVPTTSGAISVRNNAGTEVVHIGTNGIDVVDGKITIQSSLGSTILDSIGLNSTANFSNAYIFSNTPGTTTSTSYVPMSGATLGPVVITRNTNIYIFTTVYAYSVKSFINGLIMTVQGSSTVDGEFFSFPMFDWNGVNNINFVAQNWNTFESDHVVAFSRIKTFSAGTHTFNLNYKVDSGGTALFEDFAFGYIVLGN